MINLSTIEQKKTIRKEFNLRFGAVILLLVSMTLLNYLAYIIPYYISVQKKNLIVSEQFKNVIGVENKENVGESVSNIVKGTLDKMRIVEIFTKPKKSLSEDVLALVSTKNKKITFSRVITNYTANNEIQMSVSGHSETRDALTLFIDDLNKSGIFYSVEYPVSNLANSTNIDFLVNIKAKI